MRYDKYIVPIVPSFDAAPLSRDLVAAITTLFTVYTEVQIKFTFFNKNQNAFSPGDHPFKTSACHRGGGVKNWPNLPTDSSKKLPTEGG